MKPHAIPNSPSSPRREAIATVSAFGAWKAVETLTCHRPPPNSMRRRRWDLPTATFPQPALLRPRTLIAPGTIILPFAQPESLQVHHRLEPWPGGASPWALSHRRTNPWARRRRPPTNASAEAGKRQALTGRPRCRDPRLCSGSCWTRSAAPCRNPGPGLAVARFVGRRPARLLAGLAELWWTDGCSWFLSRERGGEGRAWCDGKAGRRRRGGEYNWEAGTLREECCWLSDGNAGQHQRREHRLSLLILEHSFSFKKKKVRQDLEHSPTDHFLFLRRERYLQWRKVTCARRWD